MKRQAIIYSAEELAFIQANYQLVISELHQQFVARFNRDDVSAINLRSLGKRNGWKTGRTGCFEKGNIPHPNARQKGPNKTSFKKGSISHNWQPIGHERLTKEGYLQRKITDTGYTPGDYVEVHRLVWEEHNGEIPAGHVVIFKDADKSNICLDNLLLASRADMAVMNKTGLHKAPAELKETALITAKLIRKTRAAIQQGEAS